MKTERLLTSVTTVTIGANVAAVVNVGTVKAFTGGLFEATSATMEVLVATVILSAIVPLSFTRTVDVYFAKEL